VPVHTLTAALELVGDKILYHFKSQPPVDKEPRVPCLRRGTGKGGRPTAATATAAAAAAQGAAQALTHPSDEDDPGVPHIGSALYTAQLVRRTQVYL